MALGAVQLDNEILEPQADERDMARINDLITVFCTRSRGGSDVSSSARQVR